MGQFTLFTYVRPFLETVTRVGAGELPLILLVVGVAGLVGTMLISTVLQRGFYQKLTVIPVLMALIAVGLIVFGKQGAVVVALLGFWCLIATAAPVGWWGMGGAYVPEGRASRGAA